MHWNKKTGGIQSSITNKKNLNVPTSIIQFGLVVYPFNPFGVKRQSGFQAYTVQVKLSKEKEHLKEILTHLAQTAGVDQIGWSQYDIKGDHFGFSRIYCKFLYLVSIE